MTLNTTLDRGSFSLEDWKIVQEYLSIFDSREKRTAALLATIEFEGCVYCADAAVKKEKNGRSVWCARCRKRTFLTKGSFFENMLRLDVAHGILYMLEHGVALCARQASIILACAYDTAWKFFHKVQLVIAEKISIKTALSMGPSADYASLFSRRSNQTPANGHPRDEQALCEEQSKQNDGFTESKDPKETWTTHTESTSNAEQFAESPLLQFLNHEPVEFNMLLEKSGLPVSDLSMELLELRLSNLIVAHPGERFALAAQKNKQPTNLRISSIRIFEEAQKKSSSDLENSLHYIRKLSQGISRKYLQLFLYLHWFQLDKSVWTKGELTHSCLVHRMITKEEIKSYVTPLTVQYFRGS